MGLGADLNADVSGIVYSVNEGITENLELWYFALERTTGVLLLKLATLSLSFIAVGRKVTC